MTHAIRKHLGDFVAIIVLIVLAVGIGGYIAVNQRLRLPLLQEKPFTLKAELPDARAVLPGQGQTVRIAGVRVGDIGQVELENGKAVVEMQLDKKYKGLIREDGSALLRPKTGLKDMFLEVDPGEGKPLEKNGRILVKNTAPDIDPDEVLSALDADTRDYLRLLVNGLGKGLKGRSGDLREVFRRFEPLHRDLAKVTTAIASRRRELARLVHNYGLLTTELADKDDDLKTLVTASNAVFEAFASQDANISSAVSKLPGTLGQTESTLTKVDALSDRLGPTLTSLRPAFRQLDEANAAVRPFAEKAEPIVRTQIRPFVRVARPYVRNLKPASRDLAKAVPDLQTSFGEFNRLFNMASYNKNGAEQLTGDLNQDKEREEGYLFWAAWTAQNGNSLLSTADASGPFRKVFVQATCASLFETFVSEEPALGGLLNLNDVLADASICPETAN